MVLNNCCLILYLRKEVIFTERETVVQQRRARLGDEINEIVARIMNESKASPQQYHIHKPDGFGGAMACDWRWPENRPVWTMSTRYYAEVRWYDIGSPLSEEGRAMILSEEHGGFGLWKLADKLPLERIVLMTPVLLIGMRRTLEEKYGLPRLDPISKRINTDNPPVYAETVV